MQLSNTHPMVNRIHLGDCLAVMPHIPEGMVDLILADLPYGSTQNPWDSVIPLDDLWKEYQRVLKPTGLVVLTAAQGFTGVLIASNLKAFKYKWAWRKSMKTNFLNAKKQPLREHEDVLVFGWSKGTYNPQGLRPGKVSGGNKQTGSYGKFGGVGHVQEMTGYPSDVLEFPNPNKGSIHPTQKPVPLFEYLVRTYSNPGEMVLDNAAGSATTAEACIRSGRDFICIEKNLKYFQDAEARIAKLTAQAG